MVLAMHIYSLAAHLVAGSGIVAAHLVLGSGIVTVSAGLRRSWCMKTSCFRVSMLDVVYVEMLLNKAVGEQWENGVRNRRTDGAADARRQGSCILSDWASVSWLDIKGIYC